MKSSISFLNTGILPATVMFSHGFAIDEIISIGRKYKYGAWIDILENEKDHFASMKFFASERTYNNKKYYYVILQEDYKWTDYSHVMLAHELLHISQFILNGITDINREYEFLAYLHSHLMQQCFKELRKCK